VPMRHRGFKDCNICLNKGGGESRCLACGRKRPYYPNDATREERFWGKVDKSGSCWLWTGELYRNGYGQFQSGKGERRAHRISWIWANGQEIPKGMEVDHLCRVHRCVRPLHLELVTHAENRRRARKPFCLRGHPQTEENRYLHRATGYTRCRLCLVAINQEQMAARRARGPVKLGRPKKVSAST